MMNSVCLPSDDFELPRDDPSPKRFLNFSFSPESLLWGFAIADKKAALSPCKHRAVTVQGGPGRIFKYEKKQASQSSIYKQLCCFKLFTEKPNAEDNTELPRADSTE